MDPGYRSPLVDLFLRGGATRDVRLLAARGLLPRPAPEQIALLVVLSDDPDPELAAQANATISRLPRQALNDFLAAEASPELRAFFAARGGEPAVSVGATPAGAVISAGPPAPAGDLSDPEDLTAVPDDLPADSKLVSTLAIADRLKLATKGTREQRAQLIRDSNRIVSQAVLTSPKLTESEVEAFAKMGNVSEDVLRIIGTNRSWLKNYGIIHAVTRNPKTPPAISMQLMHRLSEKDLKMLSTDRNVPEILRLAARRTLTKSKHG
jgi:hypothetical protein